MPSAARDRTQEFLATVSTFQQFNRIETINVSVKNQNKDVCHNTSQTYIEESHRIHQLTLKVDTSINNVSQTKLQQIEQLAKVTNNWKDRQCEINELIVDVNDDLYQIDQNIEYLKVVISKLNYNNNHNCASHHKALLNQLICKNEILKKLNRSTYNVAIESLQRQKKHRDTYGAPKRPSKPRNRLVQYKKQRQEREMLMRQIGDVSEENQMQMQRQMQLYDTRMDSVNYEDLRLEAVREMASEITHINGMMIDMAGMVQHQGGMIRIIDENIIKANENMDGVIGALQKYLARMTANEMLMLKVFALIIFLAIFFAIFIA